MLCTLVLDEGFYWLPFKKRTIILCISVKNKINHMDILAIFYYRYVKEWLQLLDVHKFAFLGKMRPTTTRVIVSTECTATCCSRHWDSELCEDMSILYIFCKFCENLLPHFISFRSAASSRGWESVHSNRALKWFNFYIVANNDHDSQSELERR